MDPVYANPVEIINKDIYIITNNINGKSYVGQSQNAAIRFRQHCKSSNMSNSMIGKAIKECGKENFSFRILEHQVPNYNEREKYWTARYNTTFPNGYNIQNNGVALMGELPETGSEACPIIARRSNANTNLTYAQVAEIIGLLLNSCLSIRKIAKRYNVNHDIVCKINNGSSKKYRRKEIVYPIRNY